LNSIFFRAWTTYMGSLLPGAGEMSIACGSPKPEVRRGAKRRGAKGKKGQLMGRRRVSEQCDLNGKALHSASGDGKRGQDSAEPDAAYIPGVNLKYAPTITTWSTSDVFVQMDTACGERRGGGRSSSVTAPTR